MKKWCIWKKDSWMKYKSLVFLYTSCCSLVLCVPYWTFVAKLPPCVPGSWGALVTSGPLNPRSVEGSIWCSLNNVSSTLLNYYRNNNSEIFLEKQKRNVAFLEKLKKRRRFSRKTKKRDVAFLEKLKKRRRFSRKTKKTTSLF